MGLARDSKEESIRGYIPGPFLQGLAGFAVGSFRLLVSELPRISSRSVGASGRVCGVGLKISSLLGFRS